MPIAFKKDLIKPQATESRKVFNGFAFVPDRRTVYWSATGVSPSEDESDVIDAALMETGVTSFGALSLVAIRARKWTATKAMLVLRYGLITVEFPRPERTSWAQPSQIRLKRYIDASGNVLEVGDSAVVSDEEGPAYVLINIPVYTIYERDIQSGGTPTIPNVGEFETTPYGGTGRIEYPEVATFTLGGSDTHHLIKRWQVRHPGVTIGSVTIDPWEEHALDATGTVRAINQAVLP